MHDETSDSVIERTWRNQPRDEMLTLDDVRARAAAFDHSLRSQSRLTSIVIAVVIIGNMVQMAGVMSIAGRIGIGLILLATTFVAYRFGRVRGEGPLPADLGLQQSVSFYRAQLTRHRNAVKNFWWEYALPFAPGLVIVIAERGANRPGTTSQYGALAAVFAVLIAGTAWFNYREARRIQSEIDALGPNA
jgi:hypothetical protein